MKRDSGLDILRILACLMVVLNHSPIPSDNANGVFLSAISYITVASIGLFFMVSGALLIPVKTDYLTFIRKRFSKIAIPTLLWSLIYIFLRLFNTESELNILQSIASIPFSAQGEGVLWFMYTLSGLYLLAPILSAWVTQASKKDLQIALTLWAITLCYPIFDFYLLTNSSETGILYYFTGYAGYFLLGYYLKKYPASISSIAVWSIAVLGFLLVPTLKFLNISFDFYQLFWYLSIFIAALAVGIWKLIMKISSKIQPYKSLTNISNLTFGVYLCHILVMRYWLWKIPIILEIHNYVIQTLLVAILTIIFSFLLSFCISYLPKSSWLIAFHQSLKQKN